MSARKEREKKEYFTLGSYTTRKDFRHHTMSLDDASKVRTEALRIAEFRKTKIKFVTGSRLNAKRTTPSLPAEIWEEAIDNILKPES